MSQIPDLRPSDGEITIEHCSVVLERISQALQDFDGQDGFDATIISPYVLLDYYNELFEPAQFHRIFSSETGKGVLAGIYLHWALLRMWEADAQDELLD